MSWKRQGSSYNNLSFKQNKYPHLIRPNTTHFNIFKLPDSDDFEGKKAKLALKFNADNSKNQILEIKLYDASRNYHDISFNIVFDSSYSITATGKDTGIQNVPVVDLSLCDAFYGVLNDISKNYSGFFYFHKKVGGESNQNHYIILEQPIVGVSGNTLVSLNRVGWLSQDLPISLVHPEALEQEEINTRFRGGVDAYNNWQSTIQSDREITIQGLGSTKVLGKRDKSGDDKIFIWNDQKMYNQIVVEGTGAGQFIYSDFTGSLQGNNDYTEGGAYGAGAEYAVAFGKRTQSHGKSSVSMGENCKALGDWSVALGKGAEASGNYSFSMGEQTKANADHSIALGYKAVAGVTSEGQLDQPIIFAIGAKRNLDTNNNILEIDISGNIWTQTLGKLTRTRTNFWVSSTSKEGVEYSLLEELDKKVQFNVSKGILEMNANGLGHVAQTPASKNQLIIGDDLNKIARGVETFLCLGEGHSGGGNNSFCLGKNNELSPSGVEEEGRFCWGNNNVVSKENSVCMGRSNESHAQNSITIGKKNKNYGMIALGVDNEASNNGIVLGKQNTADNSIAIGSAADVSGSKSIALGYNIKIVGNSSVALGKEVEVSGNRSFAFNGRALADDSITFGGETSNNILFSVGISGENVFRIDKSGNIYSNIFEDGLLGKEDMFKKDNSNNIIQSSQQNQAKKGNSFIVGKGNDSDASFAFIAGKNCIAKVDFSIALGEGAKCETWDRSETGEKKNVVFAIGVGGSNIVEIREDGAIWTQKHKTMERSPGSIPIGSIMMYAGMKREPPENWKWCDGKELHRQDYEELYGKIGRNYGESTDPNQFKLPDIRQHIILIKNDL